MRDLTMGQLRKSLGLPPSSNRNSINTNGGGFEVQSSPDVFNFNALSLDQDRFDYSNTLTRNSMTQSQSKDPPGTPAH